MAAILGRFFAVAAVAALAACSSNDPGPSQADGLPDDTPSDVGTAETIPDDGSNVVDALSDAANDVGAVDVSADDAGDSLEPVDIVATETFSGDTSVVGGDTDMADDAVIPGDGGCVPGCGTRACGEDPCGNYCGRCSFELECDANGACVTPASVCGDGVVGRDETCDPGADGPIEGCNANCQTNFGYTCEGEPSTCRQRDLEEAGNLCSNPIVLEGGKFFAFLGNAGPFNSYHPWYGDCTTNGAGTPSFGPDIVYALWLNAGQTVVAQMRSFVIPTTLVISTACGNDDPIDYVLNQACVAISQNRDLGTWTELRWTAPDNGWVYVITGAPGTRDIGPFELAISRE